MLLAGLVAVDEVPLHVRSAIYGDIYSNVLSAPQYSAQVSSEPFTTEEHPDEGL